MMQKDPKFMKNKNAFFGDSGEQKGAGARPMSHQSAGSRSKASQRSEPKVTAAQKFDQFISK